MYAREKGREEGRQEGRQEGKIELILTLLTQKLGEIPTKTRQKIAQLSISKIDEITGSIFTINSLEDLENMLS
jgi:predicted transposase YdaD